MPSLFLMIRFLTRWPLPESWFHADFSEDNFVRGMKWLPLVGLLVGLPAALWLCFAGTILPHDNLFGPFCAVALLIWASGGLHLDGLADTADALFANRSREKTLAIMRDSAVGAGGVIAIVLDILGKCFLVADLTAAGSSETAVVALLAAPVCGRMALVWHAAAAPYARNEPGLGAFVNRVAYRHALAASGMALALLVPFFLVLWGYGAFRPGLLALLVLCPVVLALLFARYLAKRLGGITGDTMGATIELAELTTLFIFLLAFA